VAWKLEPAAMISSGTQRPPEQVAKSDCKPAGTSAVGTQAAGPWLQHPDGNWPASMPATGALHGFAASLPPSFAVTLDELVAAELVTDVVCEDEP